MQSYTTPSNEELEGQEGHKIAIMHGRIELQQQLEKIEKVLGLNPLDRSMDSSTMFKIQYEKSSKAVGGAGKLISGSNDLEKEYITWKTT